MFTRAARRRVAPSAKPDERLLTGQLRRRLVDLIDNRLVEAVAFTSAPATVALLDAAGPRPGALLDALGTDVLAACVSPVTAAPLRRRRLILDELPPRAIELTAGGHAFAPRGHAALVDGESRPLGPAPMAVLRALARLRAGLRTPGVVQTVVRRGYRLQLD